MLRRFILLRRRDEPDAGDMSGLGAVWAALRDYARKDWPDAVVEEASFAGDHGLLQQTEFGVHDLLWFVPDELVGLANHAKWADRLACTVNRPALIAIVYEDTAPQALAFGRAHADRCFSTRDLRDESFRVAIRDALAHRTRRALITGLADHAADTGAFMLSGTASSDAGESWEATRVVPRTATGAWDMSALPQSEDVPVENALQVPGYRILSHLASGGMAEVFLAQRPTLKETVVIKVVYRDRCADPNAIRRFIQEFTLISRTRSPYVVQIYERGFLPESAYIAMEYLPEGDLAQRIAQGLSPAQAVEYARQIAHGLSAVHSLGVVHRDLKPSNILFRRNGTLAITDFGIARVRNAASRLTQEDSMVGTPYYTSPETIRDKNLDYRSDLYALGIVFYEMLTGRKPYRASDLAGLLDAHLHAPVPALSDELAVYQPIVLRLLAKDPDARFQTAEEVLGALNGLKAAA